MNREEAKELALLVRREFNRDEDRVEVVRAADEAAGYRVVVTNPRWREKHVFATPEDFTRSRVFTHDV